MKIVIFGASGFLGTKLMNFFSIGNEVIGADIFSRDPIEKLDATNKSEVEEFLLKIRPDVVIDTIALTSSVACEKNTDLANKLNFETAKNIALVCKKIGAKMVFISSSYVFDGEKGEYIELDEPFPTNQYAKTKILAEKEVLQNPNSIIIRTEPMYGYDENIKQIKFGTGTFEKESIEIGYKNLARKPIFIEDVPKIISDLLNQKQNGIFHIAGPEKVSWFDFLKNLASIVGAEEKIKLVDGSNWVVKSPRDSSLDTSKIKSLGIKTTSIKGALEILREKVN